jgi:hypothetical protein
MLYMSKFTQNKTIGLGLVARRALMSSQPLDGINGGWQFELEASTPIALEGKGPGNML